MRSTGLLRATVVITALSVLQGLAKLTAAVTSARPPAPLLRTGSGGPRPVSVIIPCYNEEKVLAGTLEAVFGSRGVEIVVVVCVDDGSSDGTLDVMEACRRKFGGRLVVLRQENGGKASALNAGLTRVTTRHFMAIDADTQVQPDSMRYLLERLTTEDVAAVSGQMLVGNLRPRNTAVATAQVREYEHVNNIDRRVLARLQVASVVPGAVGAYRTDVVASVGGYPTGTLAEDAHLTFKLLADGHNIAHEPRAVVFTEVPDTLSGLFAQRRRWSTGKIQVSARMLPSVTRSRPVVKAVWAHTAFTEALMPLVTPVLLLVLPGHLAHVLTSRARRADERLVPWVRAAVATTVAQVLVSLLCRRFARSQDASSREAAGLADASATIAALVVLPVVRCCGVASAWYDLLLRKEKRWNSVDRTGDVRTTRPRESSLLGDAAGPPVVHG